MRRLPLLVLVLLLGWPVTAGAAPLRGVRGDGVVAPAGGLLVGDRIVVAEFEDVRVFAREGGAALARTRPPVAGATVAAADGGRLLWRTDAAEEPTALVGAPRGPAVSPAPCGERAAFPAGLAGDLVAYVAVPEPTADCPGGGPAPVTDRTVVVRDLAAGGALVTAVPVPAGEAVRDLALAPGALALRVTDPRSPTASFAPLVVRALDGTVLTRLPPARSRTWVLGDGGTVVSGTPDGNGGIACPGRLSGVRVHRPGDPRGVPLGERVCGSGALLLRGDRLTFGVPRRARGGVFGSGSVVVTRDLRTGARRRLAIVAGELLDADDRTLVVTHATCTRFRVLALPAAVDRPSAPAGPGPCPFRVSVPRRVPARTGYRIPVRVRCRDGCGVDAEVRVGRRRSSDRNAVIRDGGPPVRLRVPLPRIGAGTVARVRVAVSDALNRRREVLRDVRLAGARGKAGLR